MMMPRDVEEVPRREAEEKRRDISFRVAWSQAILFGCYEVTVSYVLVVVSMLYYERPMGTPSYTAPHSTTILPTTTTSTTTTGSPITTSPDGNGTTSTTTTSTTSTTTMSTTSTTTTTTAPHTLCGSLFPTWQSAAWLMAFYSLVYLCMLVANIYFIQNTKRKVHSKVSLWVILTHPAGRLLLGVIAFFITCAFAAPVDEEKGTLAQYINRISMHVTKVAMVVDAGFVIFFVVALVKLETDWLRQGTNVYATRQLVFIQIKFAVMVCFLSSHINVIVLVILVFFCHVIVFSIWARMVKVSRKAKAKYTSPSEYAYSSDVNENNCPDSP